MTLLIETRAHTRTQIESSITSYLSTLEDWDRWRDMFQSSVGKVIIEILSGLSEMLVYKADNRLLENYLHTAMTSESSYLIAEMLGYNVNRKSASEGKVLLTFDTQLLSQITIPDGYQIYDGDTPLVVTDNHTLPVGTLTYEITVAQGEYNYILFTSSPSESYKLASIGTDSITTANLTGVNFERLTIDEGFEVENAETDKSRIIIYQCTEDSEHNLTLGNSIPWYTGVADVDANSVLLRTYYLGGITILLGDGVYGKNISSSDLLLVKYLKTLGREVSLPENTVVGSTVVEVLGGTAYSDITVSEAITGGSDEDNIDKIKYVVAGYLSAQERAVTLTDWEYVVLAYQGIVNCQIKKDDELCCTINVCALTQNMEDETHYDWDNPDSYWLESEVNTVRGTELLDYFENLKMISTQVILINPVYKDLSMDLSIKLSTTSVDTDMLKEEIKELVKTYCYSLGKTFYPTQLITDISNLEANISRVEVIQLLVDTVEQSKYDELELDWGYYFRTQSDDITISFILPT
jgi:hypothetical protein